MQFFDLSSHVQNTIIGSSIRSKTARLFLAPLLRPTNSNSGNVTLKGGDSSLINEAGFIPGIINGNSPNQCRQLLHSTFTYEFNK